MKTLIEYSDSELLEELGNRFDAFICAGRKQLNNFNNPQIERRRFWRGDYDVCIGLLHGTVQDCLHKNWGIKGDDIQYSER